MASSRAIVPAKHLFTGFRSVHGAPSRCLTRSITTEASPSQITASQAHIDASLTSDSTAPSVENQTSAPSGQPGPSTSHARPFQPQRNPFLTTCICTLHHFPSFEPARRVHYPDTHLGLPIRKDLLHRAVIFEADNTRQGTASTKWRSEVHGSNRKIRPQKGTGRARLGDKKSPMLRGGGVAFGPKPRDFGTDLPNKIYHQAWRVALSYRYRKGELTVVDGEADLDCGWRSVERYVCEMLEHNKMGHKFGRTLFVTSERRKLLFDGIEAEGVGRHARALEVADVDVKDLLELGRVVVEKRALDFILTRHELDLPEHMKLGAWRLARKREGLAV